MKPLHECGVIKDGNKRVAYLVTETNKWADGNVTDKQWNIVLAKEFEDLVKNNKIQFLVWSNNTIKCKYTEEELKILRGKGWKDNLIKHTQDNYWTMDLSFKYRHINYVLRDNAIACSLAGITKMFGMHMIPMYMYGNVFLMEKMVTDLTFIVNNSLTKTFKHNSSNVGQLILPLAYFDKMLNFLGEQYKLLFDTSTFKSLIKDSCDFPRVPIIQGKANPKVALEIVSRIDKLTFDNENILKE